MTLSWQTPCLSFLNVIHTAGLASVIVQRGHHGLGPKSEVINRQVNAHRLS